MVDVLCIIVGISEFSVVVTGFEDWKIRNFFYLGGLGLGLHSFWGTVAPGLDCQSIPHCGQPKGPFSALSAKNFGRKSFCIEIPFLPLCRKTLFWQKGSISAETGSFCRCSYNFLDLIVDLDWTDRS